MMRALLLVLTIAACRDSDPNADVCAHYAKLVATCASEPTDNEALVSDTADNLCRKGMSGKHEQLFGARYRAMVECTRSATTCAEYNSCLVRE